MIPKKIHYCWFGRGEKPKVVRDCISSWEKILPGYKIIEWNESNIDVNANVYMKEAYKEKKYAFVSDVVRAKVLYELGGFYLDTDVEVLRSFDPLLDKRCVLGFEEANYIATSFMAAEPRHKLMGDFYSLYNNASFYKKNGEIDTSTNVQKLTSLLEERGMIRNGKFQMLDGEIELYPKEYFSPYNYINCIYQITQNSFCVHHFYVSWMPISTKLKKKLKKYFVTIFGERAICMLRNLWK